MVAGNVFVSSLAFTTQYVVITVLYPYRHVTSFYLAFRERQSVSRLWSQRITRQIEVYAHAKSWGIIHDTDFWVLIYLQWYLGGCLEQAPYSQDVSGTRSRAQGDAFPLARDGLNRQVSVSLICFTKGIIILTLLFKSPVYQKYYSPGLVQSRNNMTNFQQP